MISITDGMRERTSLIYIYIFTGNKILLNK
jgi:hypothetical protein